MPKYICNVVYHDCSKALRGYNIVYEVVKKQNNKQQSKKKKKKKEINNKMHDSCNL